MFPSPITSVNEAYQGGDTGGIAFSYTATIANAADPAEIWVYTTDGAGANGAWHKAFSVSTSGHQNRKLSTIDTLTNSNKHFCGIAVRVYGTDSLTLETVSIQGRRIAGVPLRLDDLDDASAPLVELTVTNPANLTRLQTPSAGRPWPLGKRLTTPPKDPLIPELNKYYVSIVKANKLIIWEAGGTHVAVGDNLSFWADDAGPAYFVMDSVGNVSKFVKDDPGPQTVVLTADKLTIKTPATLNRDGIGEPIQASDITAELIATNSVGSDKAQSNTLPPS